MIQAEDLLTIIFLVYSTPMQGIVVILEVTVLTTRLLQSSHL